MENQAYVLTFKNGDKAYFIHQATCKNGNAKGLAFDYGAAGRSAKKPKTTTVDLSWLEADGWEKTDVVPPHVFFYLK